MSHPPTMTGGTDELWPVAKRQQLACATFSGGCFRCLRQPFDLLDGVVTTAMGYTGGRKSDPTHEEVLSGRTGHAAAVHVLYDPMRLSYEQLLTVFWHHSDPTTPNRQFCAAGAQYRAAIFYHDALQHHLAEASKQALARSQRFATGIAVRITPFLAFHRAAEGYQYPSHQSPLCRDVCGRAQRLRELWG